jgi:hypothetical protein
MRCVENEQEIISLGAVRHDEKGVALEISTVAITLGLPPSTRTPRLADERLDAVR